MKKILQLSIILGILTNSFAQEVIINTNFNYAPNGECNPFLYEKYDKWRVSHGSPDRPPNEDVIFSVNGHNNSEGLYYAVNLICGHSYDITITIRKPDNTGYGNFKIYAANGLKQTKDTLCETSYLPSYSSGELIEEIKYSQINPYSAVKVIIENWRPSRNYKRLWLLSSMNINHSGLDRIFLSSVELIDNGKIDNTPPTAPANLEVKENNNNYPLYYQNATLKWDASNDNFPCAVKYIIDCISPAEHGLWDYSIIDSTRNTEYTLSYLTPCRTYYCSVRAKDEAGNQSTTQAVLNFTTKPRMVNEKVLDQNFTNKKRKVEEAVEVIYLEPGFKFEANDENEFFIAKIGICEEDTKYKKMELNESDTEKSYTFLPETVVKIIPIKLSNSLRTSDNSKSGIGIFPNPFTNSLQISYTLPEATHCQIEIYNIYGQLQTTLVNQNQQAGTHHTYANLSGLPAGVYTCRLTTASGTTTQKIVKQ